MMENGKINQCRKPLPVLEIIRSAILVPWQRRVVMVKALAFTAFVLALLDYALDYATTAYPDNDAWLNTVIWTAQCPVFVLFAVTCHRLILLGDGSVSKYIFYKWTPRETRFLGWTIVVYLYFMAVLSFTASPVVFFAPSPEWFQNNWVILTLYIISLPGLYVLSRLSILLPATAVDERHNLSWAWNLTKGNGWRLLILIGILPMIIACGREVLVFGQAAFLNVFLYLIGYSLVVVEIALLSMSFKFLQAQEVEGLRNHENSLHEGTIHDQST